MLAPRPIKSEADYNAALEELENLMDAELDTEEGDLLDHWTILVEAYEDAHYGIPAPDPIDAILYHLESRGLSKTDLIPHIGSLELVELVLFRKRPLSLDMIRNLSVGLGIAAEVLIQPYDVVLLA